MTPYNGEGAFRVLQEEVQPNDGELSEGVDGTFGRLTMLNTLTYQEILDCYHSKAHHFKKEWQEGQCKLVCERRTVETALSESRKGGGGGVGTRPWWLALLGAAKGGGGVQHRTTTYRTYGRGGHTHKKTPACTMHGQDQMGQIAVESAKCCPNTLQPTKNHRTSYSSRPVSSLKCLLFTGFPPYKQ